MTPEQVLALRTFFSEEKNVEAFKEFRREFEAGRRLSGWVPFATFFPVMALFISIIIFGPNIAMFLGTLLTTAVLSWGGLGVFYWKEYGGRFPGGLKRFWAQHNQSVLQTIPNTLEHRVAIEEEMPSYRSVKSFCYDIARWMEEGVDAPYEKWGHFIRQFGYISKGMLEEQEKIEKRLKKIKEQQDVLPALTLMTGLSERALKEEGFAQLPLMDTREKQRVIQEWGQVSSRAAKS